MRTAQSFGLVMLFVATAGLTGCGSDPAPAAIQTPTQANLQAEAEAARAAEQAERDLRAAQAAIAEAEAAKAQAERAAREDAERRRRMERLGLLR